MMRSGNKIEGAQIKAVIFDLDGTLLDSFGYEAGLAKQFFAEQLGKQYSDQQMSEFIGLSTKEILERVAPPDRVDVLLQQWLQVVAEIGGSVELYPGILEMVTSLAAMDVKMAVATSKLRDEVKANKKVSILRDHIPYWLTADDTSIQKPHPEQVQKACKLLDVEPRETLMVGDSKYDLLAGINAGARTGAALWDVFEPESLLAFDPDYAFYTPSDIRELFSD